MLADSPSVIGAAKRAVSSVLGKYTKRIDELSRKIDRHMADMQIATAVQIADLRQDEKRHYGDLARKMEQLLAQQGGGGGALVKAPFRDLRLSSPPQELGRGATSCVYLGEWRSLPVAVKVISTAVDKAAVARELDVVRALNHPNVIQVLAVCEDIRLSVTDSIGIVMEHAALGDLQKYVETQRPSLSRRLAIALDIAHALRFCHERGLIHRDVKSSNVCITLDQRAKLMDFGLSRFLEQGATAATAVMATYQYAAPEVLLGDGLVRPSCDVYSFGVVLWELLSGQRPWDGLAPSKIAVSVAKGKSLDVPAAGWAGESAACRALVRACLSREPRDRPSFSSIYEQLRALRQAEVDQEAQAQREPPFSFQCPITHELMADPVDTADGQTYERAAIEQWLQHHGTSPVTNARLGSKRLTPNLFAKKAIAEWRGGGQCQKPPPPTPPPTSPPTPSHPPAPAHSHIATNKNSNTQGRRQFDDTPTPTQPPGPAPEGTGMQLWHAAYKGQVDQVQALCERWGGDGQVINWASPRDDGRTPLHEAYRSPQCTAILLSTPGCDVNKGDWDGQTPLWDAAYYGKPETVQALLAAPGIDLNKAPTGGDKRYIGKSPLTIARERAAEGRKEWESMEQAARRREACQEVVWLLEGRGPLRCSRRLMLAAC